MDGLDKTIEREETFLARMSLVGIPMKKFNIAGQDDSGSGTIYLFHVDTDSYILWIGCDVEDISTHSFAHVMSECKLSGELKISGGGPKLKKFEGLIKRIHKVNRVYFEDFQSPNLESIHGLFAYAEIPNIELDGLDTANVQDMGDLFFHTVTNKIDLNCLNTHSLKEIDRAFKGCTTNAIYLDKLDTSHLESCFSVLDGCRVKGTVRMFDINENTAFNTLFKGAHITELVFGKLNIDCGYDFLNFAHDFINLIVQQVLDLSCIEFKSMYSLYMVIENIVKLPNRIIVDNLELPDITDEELTDHDIYKRFKMHKHISIRHDIDRLLGNFCELVEKSEVVDYEHRGQVDNSWLWEY